MVLAPIGHEPLDDRNAAAPTLAPHTAVHVARARLRATGEAAGPQGSGRAVGGEEGPDCGLCVPGEVGIRCCVRRPRRT